MKCDKKFLINKMILQHFLELQTSYNTQMGQEIDLFHNGNQMNYSFVLMLISPTNLTITSKFQKNICFKTRVVGLININTKECKVGHHL